jgi:hypothetical protein
MSLEQGAITIIDSSDVEVFTSGNPGFVAQGTAAAVAGAWPILVTDGTDTAQVVTSNAAAAGAEGLVVYLGEEDIDVSFTQPTTCTSTSVAMTTVVATLLALNTSRLTAMFWNDGAANVFVHLAAAATTALFTVRLSNNGYYEIPFPAYTGIVTGITAAGTATVLATECV